MTTLGSQPAHEARNLSYLAGGLAHGENNNWVLATAQQNAMTNVAGDHQPPRRTASAHSDRHSPSPILLSSSPTSNNSQAAEKEIPYSVFTSKEKWVIVSLASLAGLYSPLTANSYFPAIPAISEAFHKSIDLVNLTVTVYMVLPGVSPMIWGPLSDRWGRRLMFIGCLFLLAISCVGLALTPTSAYWLLLLLRCVQAAGSASTIAIGAGVIADIAMVSERGTFFGLYNIGPMVGPAVGPIFGGGLTQGLGWRSIFWFLCIASASCTVVMILIFPETLRAMVGDGSIPAPPIFCPVIPVIGRTQRNAPSNQAERPVPKSFINPLRLFLYPEVTLLLLFNGVAYSVFYGVTASISTLFKQVYPSLNDTDIGLCFLAIGGGMMIGTVVNGKMLDIEYQRAREQLVRTGKLNPGDSRGDENFPIEVARFRLMPIWLGLFSASCIGYGWVLERHVSIVVPLLLQILMGYTIMGVMNTTQTLIVDMHPSQGSSITACNNLVRCSLGAGMVSVIDVIITSVGVGWTYVILGVLCLAVAPIMYVITRMGPIWRARRNPRQDSDEKLIQSEA